LATPSAAGSIGWSGEDLEQIAADQVGAPGHGGLRVGLAGVEDRQPGSRLEQQDELARRRQIARKVVEAAIEGPGHLLHRAGRLRHVDARPFGGEQRMLALGGDQQLAEDHALRLVRFPAEQFLGAADVLLEDVQVHGADDVTASSTPQPAPTAVDLCQSAAGRLAARE
jgi:hypothetical protein